jgi:hypothetical protein
LEWRGYDERSHPGRETSGDAPKIGQFHSCESGLLFGFGREDKNAFGRSVLLSETVRDRGESFGRSNSNETGMPVHCDTV